MKQRMIRWGKDYAGSFSFIGLVGATLFFAASVTPSLIPRHFAVQGVLSGFALAAGYACGNALGTFYRLLGFREPSIAVQSMSKRITVMCVAVVFAYFVWRMTYWQNSIRELFGLQPLETASPLSTAFIAILFATSLIGLGRLFSRASGFVSRKLGRILPERIATAVGFSSVAVLTLFLANDVVARRLLDAADAFFAKADALDQDGIDQPTSPLVCGSVESFVNWESIGRQGKGFLVDGPSRADVARLTDENLESRGGEAIELPMGEVGQPPLRVYVGLRSRPTLRERASLALEELKRVGGFERSILVVATPTGTGWLDPSAVDSLEYLHGGNSAIVSMQYSYLPSWITILVDPQRSIESADALFNATYDHWRTLPRDSRPQLYLHGLSLGSLGSERSADLMKVFEDPIAGAVWSGPPFPSQNWWAAVSHREEGSPIWLPTFRDGRLLRFTAQTNAIDANQPWGPMRNVYIQHASDPMVWFTPDLAWSSPPWLAEPRGPDVSPYLRWYPVVTFLQIAFDMAMATTVPIGYGHNYSPASYIDAWIAVTQPEGWTDEKILELKSTFSSREAPKPAS